MRTLIALFTLLFLTACVTTGGTKSVTPEKMAEGYYMSGLSYLQQHNYEMASVEFHRSLDKDKDYKQSYYGLGIINDYQGDYDAAAHYYQKAIDIDPNYSEAYNAIGVVYFKQHKWDDAIAAFKKAVANKLYTTPHIPYLNLGDLYMARKDYAKAVEAYRKSKQYADIEFTVYKLGIALIDAGRIQEAVNEFQEGVNLSPGNAAMRFQLAVAHLKDGNKQQAMDEFQRVVDIDPKSDYARQARDYLSTLRR